jgi:DNA-binding XRE family transcriptional regulator
MNGKHEKIRLILAQNIKKRRESLGLSQEQLAESADLSVQTINTIEGCRMLPCRSLDFQLNLFRVYFTPEITHTAGNLKQHILQCFQI